MIGGTKANYRCELCNVEKRGKLSKGLHVHHLVPDEYDNLIDENFKVVCGTCHETVELWCRRILSRKFNPEFRRFKYWVELLYDFLTVDVRIKINKIQGKTTMQSFETNLPEREEPPFGTYPARLIGIYDVGTQKKFKEEVFANNRTIILKFALMGDEKTSTGEFFTKDLWTTWTNSIKSTLFKTLFSLGLKSMELKEGGEYFDVPKDFDIEKFLGAPCLVTIGTKPDGTGNKITSISAPMKGMVITEYAKEDLQLLDWTLHNFGLMLEVSPSYIKKYVLASKEYSLKGQTVETGESFTDDVPFN